VVAVLNHPGKEPLVSEQNPSPEAPQPPQAPQAPEAPQQSFGQPPSAAESFGSAPAAPKKKSPVGMIIGIVVGVVILVGIVGVGLLVLGLVNKNSVANAEVGSCFKESAFTETLQDASGEKTVDCTDPTAKYKVVGIVDNKRSTEIDVDTNCAPFTDAIAGIWLGEPGEVGKVYCVSEIK